jgi:hypothetical protein
MDASKLTYIQELNKKVFPVKNYQSCPMILFVYTPVKVGSTSLVSSLRFSSLGSCIVIHVHNEDMMNVLTNYDNVQNVTILDIIYYNASIGKKVFVIDIYRTPIERKMSEYFEYLSSLHFNTTEEVIKNYETKKIIQRFNDIFPYLSKSDYFSEKYKIEMPSSFDFYNKYIQVEKEGVSFIKIRLQDSSEWGKILTPLLGFELIIIPDYKTEEKVIGELYNRVKQEYLIPNNYLEEIQESQCYMYYMTQKEQTEYYEKWGKKKGQEWRGYTKEEYSFYQRISKENKHKSEIQSEHYLDSGCMCSTCNKKRYLLLKRVKSNEKEKVNVRIIHDEVMKEKKERRKMVLQKVSEWNKINSKFSLHSVIN